MSRSKRFVAGLLSSYASIGVNILYTLASVPVALSYLDKEEFGLWALVTQLSGYLMLLEFGMSGSVARSLSDHKDTVDSGIYGSILRTGGRVFAIQGMLVAIAGLALAICAPSLLGLPARLNQTFSILMATQAIMTGIKLSLGTLGAPLWCHQRLDITNMINSVSLILSFAVLWVGFHVGFHVYSVAVSSFAGYLFSIIAVYYACKKHGYYPSTEHRGAYCPKIFRELFHFGGGLFLMNLGSQLSSASQVILVSRLLGVDSAAVWSIATKVSSMAQQFVAKILDSSAGGLAEMVVRGQFSQFGKRFKDLVSMTAVMAMAASAGIALLNGSFIEIWTSGKISWDPWNNYFLACAFFFAAMSRCLTGLTGITKRLQEMKYVYLVEGILFVLLSIVLIPKLGIAGLLTASLACNLVVTGISALRYIANYFKLPFFDVLSWFKSCLFVLFVTAILFSITESETIQNMTMTLSIAIKLALYLIIILPIIYFYGMDASLRSEIAAMNKNWTVRFRKNHRKPN
jgi:O-antigen/teichoic acid export membrane protein